MSNPAGRITASSYLSTTDQNIETLRHNDFDESLSISGLSNLSTSENNQLSQNASHINVACANARSLVDKIDSLVTLFEENNLHIAMLTETWLSKKHCPPRTMSDLTIGANLNFIRRDRGRRGGGVAVCYDPTKITMKKISFKQQENCVNTEIVCAVGNCSLTKRKVQRLQFIYRRA